MTQMQRRGWMARQVRRLAGVAGAAAGLVPGFIPGLLPEARAGSQVEEPLADAVRNALRL